MGISHIVLKLNVPHFRINGESVVPYTVKEGMKYVPLFYFEGETEHLKLKSEVVDG